MESSSKKRTKIGAFISSLISATGAGGSGTSAVCQTVCSTSSSALPLLGFSLAATPLAFLEEYHAIIWWIAVAFFIFILLTSNKTALKPLEKSFLFLNAALLIVGLPYGRTIQWVNIGFLVLGALMFGYGLYILLLSKRIVIQFTK